MGGYAFPWRARAYFVLKRAIDIFGSLLGLAVFAIPMALIAIGIKCTSKGPVLFKQKRVGRNEKVFDCYKFRSMHVGVGNIATSHLDGHEQEEMVTKFGHFLRKTSLDEVPQLLNILKGDMSFVGPRPCQPRGIEDDLIDLRESYVPSPFAVRPGVSGYAQICLHRDNDPEKKARYDAYYVRRIGLAMDLKIFLLSCLVFFGYDPGK